MTRSGQYRLRIAVATQWYQRRLRSIAFVCNLLIEFLRPRLRLYELLFSYFFSSPWPCIRVALPSVGPTISFLTCVGADQSELT